jgi:thiamine biosynthesis lipoprotein
MGTTAHIVVVDGGRRALSAAVDRLCDLDARWSRFRPDSEVSRLNDHAGSPQRVSPETALLVGLAQDGWRRTSGRFDPTLLQALRAAGYTDGLPGDAPVVVSPPPDHDPQLCGQIVLDRSAGTVCLPAGAGFDPGGIGKGLAADLVTAELAATGVAGACVNVGGDLRVCGRGPHEQRWRIAIPAWDDRVLAIGPSAVATSGITRRAWTAAGQRMHHLIDPVTRRPAESGIAAATVIAPAAWLAEIYSLAALLSTPERAIADLRGWHIEGCIVEVSGATRATARLSAPRLSAARLAAPGLAASPDPHLTA